ncbi:rhomboid family intramembrane serine protease [Halopiger goleimassiliensis]|uniref:rhomboid family intramembrane serine protease n=1 Tax=Halopiger goleimassiliensis TaxID=1293048 RepID=UPI000677FBC4|nr:rhomboid family intramembrane serine protease [Halopiger goleimassiliensis]
MSSLVGVALTALALLTVLGSVAVVRRLHDPDRGWYEVASSRLVYGVPWGTFVVMAFVLVVYLFVQDGITAFSDPVSIPFRAWSYFSPLGMAVGSFAHVDAGHLIGNLAGTLVVAPIAEFVWGHYPDGRNGEATGSSSAAASTARWHTPWVRAVVVFPAVVVAIGLVTSLFSLGPVIGFSGVVYAFAGFAIVRYPIGTLVASTLVQSAVLTLYRTLETPILYYVAEPSPPTAPSWANVAIQGHALGFLVGLVLGIVLLQRRGEQGNPVRLWVAIALFAFYKGLWQIYWFGEGNAFYLLRGPGIVVVLVLAVVITVAITASTRPLRSRDDVSDPETPASADVIRSAVVRPLELAQGAYRDDASAPRFERVRALTTGTRRSLAKPLSPKTCRGAAFTAVVVVLAIVAGMAIPTNLFVLSDPAAAGETSVDVADYTVEYGEGVENQLVSGIGIEAITDNAGLEAYGVIVSSEERNMWWEVVSADYLEYAGQASIVVGGPGWRETVHAERRGWTPVGNGTVYQIHLWADGEAPQLAYESGGEYADVRIDDRSVALVPHEGEFVIGVGSRDDEEPFETAPIPEANASVEIDGITFERDDARIYASVDGTEVAVAEQETYR